MREEFVVLQETFNKPVGHLGPLLRQKKMKNKKIRERERGDEVAKEPKALRKTAAMVVMTMMTSVALLCAALVLLLLCAPEAAAATAEETGFEITWVGDTLLLEPSLKRVVSGKKKSNGKPKKEEIERKTIASDGYLHPLDRVKVLLESSYVIGVQEGPVTPINMTGKELNEIGKGDPCCYRDGMSYSTKPPAALAEAEVGYDAVSLANNHMFDRGEAGFHDTINILKSVGIKYFGGGVNATEASEPHVIDTGCCGKICVVGLYDAETGDSHKRAETWTATPRSVGMWFANEKSIAAGYAKSKELKCNTVVASVHWGQNYKGISDVQMDLAQRFVQEGYDLVVGHHPHVIQPLKVLNGVPIIFSLGNFVFGTPGRFTDEYPGYGLVSKTTFDKDGLRKIVFHCIYLDAKKLGIFQPRLCKDDHAKDAFRNILQVKTIDDSLSRSELGDLTVTLHGKPPPAEEKGGAIIPASVKMDDPLEDSDIDYYYYLSTGHSRNKFMTDEGSKMIDSLMARRPWWKEYRTNSERLDFCFERYDMSDLCEGKPDGYLRVFNWFQRSRELHAKDLITKNILKFAEEQKRKLKWMPETHIIENLESLEPMLPIIKERFDEYSRGSSETDRTMHGNLWIVKPAFGRQGMGIEMFDKYEDIESFLRNSDNYDEWPVYLVQKYIERPLLLDGKKFDLRTHVLITAEPKYYVYPYGYVRVSATDYARSNTNLNTHLTNVHIQIQAGANEQKSMLTFAELEEEFEGRLSFERDVFPQMLVCLEELFSATQYNLWPEKVKGRFYLYIADWILDEDFNLHFIELNAGPGTNNGLTKAFSHGFGVPYIQWYTRNMVEEMFQKVLDPHFPMPDSFLHADAPVPKPLNDFKEIHVPLSNSSGSLPVKEEAKPNQADTQTEKRASQVEESKLKKAFFSFFRGKNEKQKGGSANAEL